MSVEQATLADYAAILASSGDFWGERDVRALHHTMFVHEFGDTAFVISDTDGAVVAYLFGFVAPTRVGYVHVVGVHAAHRRRGLARELYTAFEQAARERGAVALKAITRPANQASIAFHRALGMSATEVPDYSGAGQDRVVFRREFEEVDADGGARPPFTAAAEPRIVWMPGGVRTEVHLSAEDTGGAFCMLIDHPPAGWSLPAHRHQNEAETIHVLEGQFQIEVAGLRSHLSPGQTIHIPQGAVHSSANVGLQDGRRVLLFSPAGMERFFLEAGTPLPGEAANQAGTLACAVRHGWEFVGEQ